MTWEERVDQWQQGNEQRVETIAPLLRECFEAYKWNNKHKLYGYPPDQYPKFYWINSLEQRFKWLGCSYSQPPQQAGIHLIREMLAWGGSQAGRREDFDDAFSNGYTRDYQVMSIYALFNETVCNLEVSQNAICSALKFPGMDLTYASKLLRFLNPNQYGALDSRLCKELELPKMTTPRQKALGYCNFLEFLRQLRQYLEDNEIERPDCSLARANNTGWRLADIEMALFQWAERQRTE